MSNNGTGALESLSVAVRDSRAHRRLGELACIAFHETRLRLAHPPSISPFRERSRIRFTRAPGTGRRAVGLSSTRHFGVRAAGSFMDAAWSLGALAHSPPLSVPDGQRQLG